MSSTSCSNIALTCQGMASIYWESSGLMIALQGWTVMCHWELAACRVSLQQNSAAGDFTLPSEPKPRIKQLLRSSMTTCNILHTFWLFLNRFNLRNLIFNYIWYLYIQLVGKRRAEQDSVSNPSATPTKQTQNRLRNITSLTNLLLSGFNSDEEFTCLSCNIPAQLQVQ